MFNMVVEGYLERLDFLTLIGFLSYSNKTGILQVSVGLEDGLIFFRNGEIVDAYFNSKYGETALVDLIINYPLISFRFFNTKIDREKRIEKSSERLILELLKVLDENKNKEILVMGGQI